MSLKARTFEVKDFIFLFYLVVLAVLIYRHETWRDEVQAYLLARESHSLREIFYNTRYEGHPSLWFILLYLFKWIWPAVSGMKLLHFLISGSASWLFWKYSPFRIYQKICLLFGYYLLFEYGCIARNYSLGILFLFLFCVLYHRRAEPNYLICLSCLILLMMLSNFYAFFLALGFCLLLFYEIQLKQKDRIPLVYRISSCLIVLAGIFLFLLDTVPPADYGYASEWVSGFHAEEAKRTVSEVFKVLLPIPSDSQYFWNSNIISNVDLLAVGGFMLLCLIFIFVGGAGIYKFTMLFVFAEILLFSYVKFPGYLRHNGHLMIAMVGVLWIQISDNEKQNGLSRIGAQIFSCLLTVQLIASYVVSSREFREPFSESKNVADFIRSEFSDHLLVSHEDAAGSAVTAFLPDPVYYPASRSFGSFMIWNQDRYKRIVTLKDIIRQGDSLNRKTGKPILYLLNFPANDADSLRLRKTFTRAIEPAEQYYLYTAK